MKKKKRKTLSTKEKNIWNVAVRAATNELFLYDGIIQDGEERVYMRDKIREKLLYKIK